MKQSSTRAYPAPILVGGRHHGHPTRFHIILPRITSLILISIKIKDPNGPLATALSLFPLTVPGVMITRLAAGMVPIWQVALSAGILLATAIVVMRVVTRMLRVQTLLSGQPFDSEQLIMHLLV